MGNLGRSTSSDIQYEIPSDLRPDTVVLRSPRLWPLVGFFASFLTLLAATGIGVLDGSGPFGLDILAFLVGIAGALLGAMCLWQVFRPSPTIILDGFGMTDRRSGYAFIPWDEMVQIRLVADGLYAFLCIRLRNAPSIQAQRRSVSAFERCVNDVFAPADTAGDEIAIPVGLMNHSPARILELVEQHRERALRQAMATTLPKERSDTHAAVSAGIGGISPRTLRNIDRPDAFGDKSPT